MATIKRRVQAYAIHAHSKNFEGDYENLFARVEAIEKRERLVLFGSIAVAMPDVQRVGDNIFLTFTEGEVGLQPMILDTLTGETREEELERNEILVAAAHALVNPAKRRILIEYVRTGAKAEAMARTIEKLLSERGLNDIRVDFSPVIEENFIKEIDRFDRIRMASLTLIKPNAGWDDHYTHISDMLQSSGGEKAELSVRAPRGESLNKDAGIVEVIKDVVSDDQPYISDAEIVGVKRGEEAETVVPLKKHVVHSNIAVTREANGGVNVLRLREKMLALMGALF